jgi:hypothetical protein
MNKMGFNSKILKGRSISIHIQSLINHFKPTEVSTHKHTHTHTHTHTYMVECHKHFCDVSWFQETSLEYSFCYREDIFFKEVPLKHMMKQRPSLLTSIKDVSVSPKHVTKETNET